MRLDFNHPLFEDVQVCINKEINRVLENTYDGQFAEGEITIKLNLKIDEAIELFPDINGDDKEYSYKKPIVNYAVSSVLKKQRKISGTNVFKDSELQLEDGEFILEPVAMAQFDLFK